MAALARENICLTKPQCEDAERMYYEKLSGAKAAPESLSAQIERARQHIKNSLECVDGLAQQVGGEDMALASKLSALELENRQLKKLTDDLKKMVMGLEGRVASLEGGKKAAPAAAAAKEEDDDDVDLFGSEDEEEDEEKARITAERLKAYAEKKSKKPALIAKTSVLFDVKPWDDETDMNEMLKAVKTIEKDGLTWGANKLVPVGYGINKLQIMCVVEDEKVSLEELSEQIEAFEDYVQSVDIAAMNKI
uniref:Elongation factor 1-delta n=1 Tax=Pseudodiaptomus poplesia TaxID=213370 RepID=A0A1S6GLB9_9MAXI|nr:elongation factor 1-delta [Pseudodiaptomus poplesia]